jgi:hypothetical protein
VFVFIAGFVAYLVLFALTDRDDAPHAATPSDAAPTRDGTAQPANGDAPSSPRDAGRAVRFETTELQVGELPPRLRPVASKILAGHRLERTELTQLTTLARGNRDLAATHLLLGRAYMNLGWHSDGIQRYVIAWQTDPEARRDAQMLADLVDLVPNDNSGPAAVEALELIYGDDAIEAIDDRLASPGLRAAGSQKLTQLRATLERR